jgi:2-C-methyl-D-erythritol 2,4-cyclodiphosphate synthase
MLRVGFGYDAHRLTEGRELVLGGVRIPHEKGLLGHSDADVLSHAIGEAILGAMASGDLGTHFPDTDQRYTDMSSLKILSMINDLAGQQNAGVVNIDSTIVAQEPKLSGHIPEMRRNIADALNIQIEQVSVKATTTEGMGFAGAKEGMAAYAVVLMDKK